MRLEIIPTQFNMWQAVRIISPDQDGIYSPESWTVVYENESRELVEAFKRGWHAEEAERKRKYELQLQIKIEEARRFMWDIRESVPRNPDSPDWVDYL